MSPEEETERLRVQLKESQEQLHQAAQAGLDLLNQQVELQSRLDEQRVEMTNALEALEQDRYSLQKEVELKTRMLESLQSDHDCVKKQQQQQLQEQRHRLERSHSSALTELNDKLLRLQSSLEESQLQEKQLRHQLEVQSESLSSKVEELRALSERAHTSMTSEMMEVEVRMAELEDVKVELEQTLQQANYRAQQLELTNRTLQRHLEQKTEEKEDREKEAVSYFSALEKCREANRELQVQLDQALQQAQDPNSKGNSLFAELEDKRADMERQLISMKVQHQSLLKQQVFTKQQLQQMKVHIATLMQLQGARADPVQLERLQAMLCEKNAEIQNLMTKLRHMEKEGMALKSQSVNCAPAEGSGGSGGGHEETYYTDLLKMKLSKAVQESERLGDELALQRMKSLSESQRALELERKLFSSERTLRQAQSDKIRMQLRIEELQQKYQPKASTKNLVQKRTKERFPVDPVTSCEPALDSKEQIPPPHTEALLPPSAQTENCTAGSHTLKPPPAKSVKISAEDPVVIPEPLSALTDSREMEESWQQENKERRRKKREAEMIHVSSSSTMENQCAQQ